jgi:hypothetical protein
MDDPRTQIGPFKYDLYGVSNHIGTLSSGHCELFSIISGTGLTVRYGFRERCQGMEVRRGQSDK